MDVISGATTIREVMGLLDRSQSKLCLMTAETGRLVRTFTDGDIRRALLAGSTLDTVVGVLPIVSPITYPQGTPPGKLLDAMRAHSIHAVVIVDADNVPVDVVVRTDLEDPILLSPPHMGTSEVALVQQAFDENWVAPAGPHLSRFEEKLAVASGRKHALALSSGTAALHLAICVLAVGPGDRI